MNLTINIQGLDSLVEALNRLALALGCQSGMPSLLPANTQPPMPQGQTSTVSQPPVNNIPTTPPVSPQPSVSPGQFPVNPVPAVPANPAPAGQPPQGGVTNVQPPSNGVPQTQAFTGAPSGQFPVNGVPVNPPMAGGPQPTIPPTQGQQPSPTIPTTALPTSYTPDQLAVAMTGLVDQGKQPQVMQILTQFGAQSLMQVPKEQYPALAMHLRGLGANL